MRRRDFLVLGSGSVLGIVAGSDGALTRAAGSSRAPAAERVDLPAFLVDPALERAVPASAALRGQRHLAGAVMLTILGLHRPAGADPEFDRVGVDVQFPSPDDQARVFHAFIASAAELEQASRAVRLRLPIVGKPAELLIDLEKAGRVTPARVRLTPGFAPDLAKLREGDYLVPLSVRAGDPLRQVALHLRIESAPPMPL